MTEQAYTLLLHGIDTLQCAYYLRPVSGRGSSISPGCSGPRSAAGRGEAGRGQPLTLGGVPFLLTAYGTRSGYPFLLSERGLQDPVRGVQQSLLLCGLPESGPLAGVGAPPPREVPAVGGRVGFVPHGQSGCRGWTSPLTTPCPSWISS